MSTIRNSVAGAMTMRRRRYEMLLPLGFNDGRDVDAEVFKQTRQERLAQVGCLSALPDRVQGTWLHEGRTYEDELLRWVVDVDDTVESQEFFTQFKMTLLQRFEQIEIYIVSYPIE